MNSSNTQAVILNVGQVPWLLHTRTLVLRSAGYIVESTESVGDAIHHLRAGDFDLVILCHSIPKEERRRLIRLIRADGSSIPVVCVAPVIEEDLSRDHADNGIHSEPASLLSDINELLQAERSRSR